VCCHGVEVLDVEVSEQLDARHQTPPTGDHDPHPIAVAALPASHGPGPRDQVRGFSASSWRSG
jgi:hypothetical protein